MQPKIGLVGVVREEMKADFWATMARLAEMGYEGVELGGGALELAGVEGEEFRIRLAALGMQAISRGSQKYRIAGKEAEVLDEARAMGCDYLCFSWGPCESREQLLEDAALYTRLGRRCRELGLQMTYHNHNHEFQTFDGETGFDILMNATDPDLLKAHMDIGWAAYAGMDPAALIRRYAGRCPVLHVRDARSLESEATGNDERKRVAWTEIGEGVLDLAAAVAAAKESGVRWLTVEGGSREGVSPWDSAAVSLRNLRALLG